MKTFTLAHSYISLKHWYVNEDSHLKNIRKYTRHYAQVIFKMTVELIMDKILAHVHVSLKEYL